MSAELLLRHFVRISEAPDAIPRLRQFILELAVRGKLVNPDSNDEPVSALLNCVQLEKERLLNENLLKEQRSLPQVQADEAWFDIPTSWRWVRLGTITQVVMGQSPPGDTYNKAGEGIPLINGPVEFTEGPFGKTFINQYTTAPTNLCEEGDLLLCVRGSTTGRTNIAGFRACIGRGVAAIRPFFDDQYVRLFVWRLRPHIIALGRGIAFPSVSRKQIEELQIPLPPLAEQQRIVAKVNELMALCDQLAAVKAERREARSRLVVATLQRLNQPDDEDSLREHADFAINHLARLTTRVEDITKLRETILNLAVRGKLVSQRTEDGLAAELLKNIQSAKTALVKDGLIPRSKVRAGSPKLAFEVPPNWVAIRFDDVCNLVTSGSRGWAEHYAKSGPKFVRAQNIRFGRLRLDELACVNPPAKSEGLRTKIAEGDLLVVITGAGVTNPALMDRDLGEAYVSQHVALIKPTTTALSRWLLLCLMAGVGGRDELVERAYGAGKPGLNLDNIRTLSLPLPPLAEQERIVEKVGELMALCDNLEVQLANAENDSGRLLEAVLHEALTDPALAEAA